MPDTNNITESSIPLYMRRIFLAVFVFFICVYASHAQSLAIQADSAYNHQDYNTAVRLYHQAINNEGVSPQLYYNLGNAYYRVGKLGRSVLFYRRALKLDPSFSEARDNLAFVNTQILDKPEDDSSFLGNLHRSILEKISPNAWAWTAFALFAVTLLMAALYVFAGNIAFRKLGFFGGFIFLALFIYALTIAHQSSSGAYNTSFAVIITPTSNLSTSPGGQNENSKIIPLHEGTVVEITDSIVLPSETSSPLWYNVKINNSTSAWARSADLERI